MGGKDGECSLGGPGGECSLGGARRPLEEGNAV